MLHRRSTLVFPGSLALAASLLLLAVGAGCSSRLDVTRDAGSPDDAQVSDAERPDTSTPRPDAGTCSPSCPMGQSCLSGVCCPMARSCRGVCCAEGALCSFGTCVVPGAECEASEDCGEGAYCDYAVTGPSSGGDVCLGSTARRGRCLPRPPSCSAGGEPGETCLDACEVRPDHFTFTPRVRYTWPTTFADNPPNDTPNNIMMAPIVVQLDDDNCDERVDSRDVPDILFTTFQGGGWSSSGTLHAITVRDGRLVDKWTYPNVLAIDGLAGGDFHSSPGGEVVACSTTGAVLALSGTGRLLWSRPGLRCVMPALADLDQDGHVEVIVEGGILDGETGAIAHAFATTLQGFFTVADIDDDGKLDVVGARQAFRANGESLVDTIASIPSSWDNYMFPAVVDLDLDGKPEVVADIASENKLAVWRYSESAAGHAEIIRAPFAAVVNPGGPWGWSYGMGPITAGDFDGDHHPDIAYVGFRGYVVLSGAKLVDTTRPATLTADGVQLWKIDTDEDNGSTGSALFDFNGDGRVEVLYNDTERVHIMSGVDGTTVGSLCNTTGSQWEYPVVADVDGDGEADVIVVANSFAHVVGGNPSYVCDGTWQAGLRVLSSEDGSWVRAPRVWNEHAYHVTNVDENGQIPRTERANWSVPGLNNFRQNRQPNADYAAPDAAVLLQCIGASSVLVIVRNLGEAPLPAGLEIAVTNEAGATIATVSTTRTLGTAQSESLEVMLAPEMLGSGLRATVQRGPRVRDCRADNDSAPLVCVE